MSSTLSGVGSRASLDLGQLDPAHSLPATSLGESRRCRITLCSVSARRLPWLLFGRLPRPGWAAFPPSGARSLPRPGVVSHIRVLSDKVPDISSMAAWAQVVHQTGHDRRGTEGPGGVPHRVHVPASGITRPRSSSRRKKWCRIRSGVFNDLWLCVLQRGFVRDRSPEPRPGAGGPRGRILNEDIDVPEVFYDGGWRLMDASLITLFFPRPTARRPASTRSWQGLKEWYEKLNPGYKGNQDKLRGLHAARGWRKWPG